MPQCHLFCAGLVRTHRQHPPDSPQRMTHTRAIGQARGHAVARPRCEDPSHRQVAQGFDAPGISRLPIGWRDATGLCVIPQRAYDPIDLCARSANRLIIRPVMANDALRIHDTGHAIVAPCLRIVCRIGVACNMAAVAHHGKRQRASLAQLAEDMMSADRIGADRERQRLIRSPQRAIPVSDR